MIKPVLRTLRHTKTMSFVNDEEVFRYIHFYRNSLDPQSPVRFELQQEKQPT